MNVLYYYQNMISLLVSHCYSCSITKLQYFSEKFKFKALMTINSTSNTVRIQITSHICYHPINRVLAEYAEDP
jgi:hypothetical protein